MYTKASKNLQYQKYALPKEIVAKNESNFQPIKHT